MCSIRLDGKYVYLEEVNSKYFQCIVDWRNNPENNRYLNQPYKLTIEKQKEWYEKVYLQDKTQGLFVLVDIVNDRPFGTLGWTDYDFNRQICISGRLLVDGAKYRVSKSFLEAALIYNNYLYNKLNVTTVYAHIAKENKASKSWSKNWGFRYNEERIMFPKELLVNGMEQDEYIRTLDDYLLIKKKVEKILKL